MQSPPLPAKAQIVIADDHPVALLGLQGLVAQLNGMEIAGVARDSTETLALLRQRPCNILLTDYVMPGGACGDGLHMILFLRRRYPKLPIVVITMLDTPALIGKLVRCKRLSVVSKRDHAFHIQAALGTALAGGQYLSPFIEHLLKGVAVPADARIRIGLLSPRETNVIRRYLSGMSVSQIAAELGRSIKTVSTQKMSAMRKLGVHSDLELYGYAASSDLLGPSR